MGATTEVKMAADTDLKSGGNGVDRGTKTRPSLEDLDRRTGAYRKTSELIDAVEVDCGGADALSTAERSIIRHAALTGAMLEDLGGGWLKR